MKICPTCSRKYEDETLKFCLEDGSRLEGPDPQATWHLPQESPSEARRPVPPTAPSPPATITARPEHFQALRPPTPGSQSYAEERAVRNPLPWILGIVLVLGASGVLIAWILTRGSSERVARIDPSPTPRIGTTLTPEATPDSSVMPTPKATPTLKDEKQPKPTPTPTTEIKKPQFSIMNNTSLDGSRITYYPRPSFAQCQADCAANGNCRGFAWIRPGAYNPGDSAMCYLLSAVTGKTSHPCCIAGVKN